jgi:hypothetical protein
VIYRRVDDQVYYVDLNEVVSKVRINSKQSDRSLTLKDFVQKINLTSIVPNIESDSVQCKFEKSYWSAYCRVKNSDGHESEVFVCKSRAKMNDGLPAAQLLLRKNSDLYNLNPESFNHLLKDNLLYLFLRDCECICLAIFKLDDKANAFIKVCSEKFDLPREVMQSNRRRSLPDIHSGLTGFVCLISIKSRVFSVYKQTNCKNLLWIHCFMGKRIRPIGGSNTNIPGLYSLNPKIELQYKYYDGNFVGLFGVDEIHFRRGNDRVYKRWRYVFV